MPPQTQSGASSLDPDAVNLAKAIRQVETGGNFNVAGKSGEYGAYQYTEPTWAKDSAAAGVHVPLKQSTKEQQNQVAYTKIKAMKDAGLNVGQIASSWNAGEGEPNAYTGKFNDGAPSTGINKFGVHYDVPKYATSVAKAYQTIKTGGQVQADPNNPSSTANQTPVQPPTPQAQPQQNDLLDNPVTRGIQNIFPGKQVGQAIGTLGGLALEKAKGLVGGQDNSATYDTSAPSPLQVAGDVAQGALMVGAGLPEATQSLGIFGKSVPVVKAAATGLGRIGQTAALGAGLAGTGALAQGNTDIGDIAKQTAVGAATGGALGAGGELIGKAAQYLPQRIARSFIPGLNQEGAKYAVSKGLGRPTKMLTESESSLNTLGTKLDSVLNKPEYKTIVATPDVIYGNVAQQFPHTSLNNETIATNLKRLVPLHTNLVDKLSTTGLSLPELNTLKSAIGNATYKTVFDDPAVKAGKQVGNAVYQSIKQFVTKAAPESTPIFEDFTKEIQLNGALQKAIRNGQKAKSFTLRDLVALTSGLGVGGPMGGLAGLAAEKALTSPTVNLNSAGLLSKLAGAKGQELGRVVAPTILRNSPK